jgi:TonB-linked SusC/RagA family outer membrane protein
MNHSSQIQALLSLEQNLRFITQGLKAKVTFSFDSYADGSVKRATSPTLYGLATGRDEEGNLIGANVYQTGSESLGHEVSGGYGNKRTYFEANLTYDRTFKKHNVNGLLLYNQQSYDDGSIQPYRKQGIAGRASYVYDNKYVAEVNFGYNGSENFAPGQRFGLFPSFALGWRISDEPWMQWASKTMNKLKVRASYGKVGNDSISGRRFAYITTVWTGQDAYYWGENSQYGFGGITEGDPGVTGLTWETAWKKDIGFELGLWDALDINLDFFEENRSNIFMQRKTIPTQTGFMTSVWSNFGKVNNRGFDGSLNFNKHFGEFFLSLRGTFTYARNTVLEYDEPESVKNTYRSQTGIPMGTQWGLQAIGLYTKDDFDSEGNLKFGLPKPEVGATGGKVHPGDIKYKDMDGDGYITNADEGYIGGTYDPEIVYGFGANFVLNNFDFGFFFQGVADAYKVIGGNNYFLPASGQGVFGNSYSNANDRWTVENPSQNVFWPRLHYNNTTHNLQGSTWWMKNMAFLRLKNIELGYSLPKSVVEKIHLGGLRFYVSGNDLFTISGFKLWDPELDTTTGLRYPTMKSVQFGLDLKF